MFYHINGFMILPFKYEFGMGFTQNFTIFAANTDFECLFSGVIFPFSYK
jgi:hypothetical protein